MHSPLILSPLLLNIPLLLIGFFLLNRSAGFLVDGGSSIARRFLVPESMIAFTIVAIGTSLPKLFTNIMAAYNGYFDLVFGNIIGSSIINILGIISITGFKKPIRVNRNTMFFGIPISMLAIIIIYCLVNYPILHFKETFGNTTANLNFKDGIILLAFFVVFMSVAFFLQKKHSAAWFDEKLLEKTPYYNLFYSILFCIIGIIGLYAGAILVVDNLIDLSRNYNLSQRFLGQFILSFGGSISMLYWTMSKKTIESKYEVSSLIGTNILNFLLMFGICACIQTLPYNTNFNIDLVILFGVSFLLMLLLWYKRKLTLNMAKSKFLFFLLLVYIVYLCSR